MNPADLIPALLLLLLAAALVGGAMMVGLIAKWRQAEAKSLDLDAPLNGFAPVSPLRAFWRRPACWLAIRSRNLSAGQAALGLREARLCSWSEGLSESGQLFISPPCEGWILVFGAGLPDPAEDVDASFRFLLELSRRLGHVQFFKADAVLHHHAWVRVEAGSVVRAYAWAGKTLWNQGAKTPAEIELGLKCFAYAETISPAAWGLSEIMATNAEKVSRLASRWSLNPSAIDARFLEVSRGVAGWPGKRI
jgi:hypothetical protein